MTRYLIFTAVKEVDLPNINPGTTAYQAALKDHIQKATDEIMTLADDWIVTYRGEDEI